MRRDIYAPDRATLSDNLYLAKNSRRRRPEVLVAADDQGRFVDDRVPRIRSAYPAILHYIVLNNAANFLKMAWC
jgi:hypothetical protein